jgi:hypothetical protein
MPKFARVTGFATDGSPIHKEDNPKTRAYSLTASDYNKLRQPESAGGTIAKAVKWRQGSIRVFKFIACQECFPSMVHRTVEEREFFGRDLVCGHCRMKLERVDEDIHFEMVSSEVLKVTSQEAGDFAQELPAQKVSSK